MDSLFKFAKKLLEALSKYACCVCSKQGDDDDESNDLAVTSLRSPPDSSKINNGVLMRSISSLDNSQNIKQSESSIKENISEKLEKNLNIQNEMDGLKSMTTKVGNGFKGLTDTITSKTRNIKNKSSGDSPFKKITEKLHIKSRKSGGKSPDDHSKFDRIKRYSHKLADKARCNKRSNHEIDPDSRPSFGKRRNKANGTAGVSEFNGSYIDTIESESVRY
ncbi:hypothetical protein BpHYR1_017515 [Brachionus plicatilis]|uniref:Uncharacterized protein n=1 Tax=Brachionus plicatilis TaxID=10195 RepID=A0A3M7T429_BRAPC|nr:hypothetical protein BpHYR1_017515 [Brachionus plicatilis]